MPWAFARPCQTRFVIPAESVHIVPDGVSASRAILAANLETAVNGVWDASPHLGDRIAVIGGGTVGCLAAWLVARIPGCRVELIDLNPRRAAVAAALRVPFAEPEAAARDADLVIHASGTPEGLELALQVAHDGALGVALHDQAQDRQAHGTSERRQLSGVAVELRVHNVSTIIETLEDVNRPTTRRRTRWAW